MVRIVAVLVALSTLSTLSSCTAGQSRRAHRAGEVVAAASLFAMLGTIIAAKAMPSEDQQIYDIGRACIPFTVFGAFLYAATDRPQMR